MNVSSPTSAAAHAIKKRALVEAALTLFIIVIFCLSAAQVLFLLRAERSSLDDNFVQTRAQIMEHMQMFRVAADIDKALLAYYIGEENFSRADISVFFDAYRRLLVPVKNTYNSHVAFSEQAHILDDHLNELESFLVMERPVSSADRKILLEGVAAFRRANQELRLTMRAIDHQNELADVSGQHKFLSASIISMAVSGLGLIVLLILKLRATEGFAQERQSLVQLLQPRIAAIESAMDGIALVDQDGTMTYVNKALADYFGYDNVDELSGQPWTTIYNHEQQEWFRAEVLPLLRKEGRWRGHAQGLRRDGSSFHQDVAITRQDNGGYVLIMRDYTELHESISLSNRRLAAIEAAGDGIGIVDNKGRLIYINEALRDLHGLDEVEAQEYIGNSWMLLYTRKGRQDIDNDVLPRLNEFGTWQGEAPLVRADGSIVYAELSLTLLPDGGMIGTARDVSERKKAEEEKEDLQRQFYQAQKMEAIGRMAGGIAHDFNNILSSILGYTDFLIEDLPKESEQRGFAKQIRRGGMQARELVDQILAFSRRREGSMVPISVGEAVNDCAVMLKSALPNSVKLTVEEEESGIKIRANATQIGQALMNLCVNAIDAVEEREQGQVRVTSGTVRIADSLIPAGMLTEELPPAEEEPRLNIFPQDEKTTVLMSGQLQHDLNYAFITVSDNGEGMNHAVMQHIFEPFFTTKAQDSGTGLGLAAVHGIVAGHRGAMIVVSTVDEGTSFTLYFPQTEEPVEKVNNYAGEIIEGQGRILVVDDQPDVAAVAAMILQRLGYETDICLDGAQAVDSLREKPRHYDLVLSDFSMPGMTGLELAQTVHEDFPRLPVILMTGYSRKKLEKALKENSTIAGILRKPLDKALVSQIVHQALTRNKAA